MLSFRPSRRLVAVTGAALLLAAAGVAWWFVGGASSKRTAERIACALPAQDAATRHPGMVWVPGGSFELGDTVYPEERAPRRAMVEGFWMDRTEVSNDEFGRFVSATGYVTVAERPVDEKLHPGLPPEMRRPGAVVFVSPASVSGLQDVTQWWRYIPGANWRHPGGPGSGIEGRGSFPVVTIAYQDALAFAKWKGRQLPSEAQWEWAARAAQPGAVADHEQPKQANTWQGLFPVLNSADDGFVGLAPVGCYAPNALGLFDMIGNVWEITADAWAPGQRVIKGGSFLCAPNFCLRYRAGARQPQEDDLGASHLGFRTVLMAPGP